MYNLDVTGEISSLGEKDKTYTIMLCLDKTLVRHLWSGTKRYKLLANKTTPVSRLAMIGTILTLVNAGYFFEEIRGGGNISPLKIRFYRGLDTYMKG